MKYCGACCSSKQRLNFLIHFLEHEACIRDITELKWQLKLEREKLDQAQEKLSHTEVLNQRLHEDIGFAKKQVPIVKENMDLQRGIINQINTAQAEVTSNLIYSCFKNNFYVYIFKPRKAGHLCLPGMWLIVLPLMVSEEFGIFKQLTGKSLLLTQKQS